MSLHQPVEFQSPSAPSQTVSYVHLNKGAPRTLLFCYGAAASSLVINLFESFVDSHPDLSLLSVDRWAQREHSTRTGISLLSDLSRITLELLDSLQIETFHIAGFSAGAYQLLDLARTAGTNRVGRVFPISTHIPASYTNSKVMRSMCTMPNFLFKTVTKLDSPLGKSWAGNLLVDAFKSVTSRQDSRDGLVVSKSREELVTQHIQNSPSPADQKASQERFELDYSFVYERLEGVTGDTLTRLYADCPVAMTWIVADGDIFFGPESVRRIVEDLQKERVEVVVIPQTTHADVYLQLSVWEKMYSKIVE